ncbi:MAG: nicotinate-nucleotide adenylyltransferase [Planctomycetes bacterium]|nr:nicotinate-nucleotide adenylyltransferase [Planctomycetota bacterium]
MKLGVLGGSFDPIHLGHLIIAEEAYHTLGLSKVIFVPANVRPHKGRSHQAGAKARYAMTRAAIRNCPHFEASDMEIRREGTSYSVDTLKDLKRNYGTRCRIYFIIGADSLPELPSWKNIREVARLCAFAVARRPGSSLGLIDGLSDVIGHAAVDRMRKSILDVPFIGISSSDIRERIRKGRSIAHMIPNAVATYIERHGLYRE